MTRALSIDVLGESEPLVVEPQVLIVAGYTGRDESTVREHIEELAAIGVAPPEQVPMLYDLDPALLTTMAAVAASDNLATGEVEPVFICHGGRWYLGVGSDLTDRDRERDDVKISKAACPKPMGTVVVPLPENVADGGFDAEWDRTVAASYVDDELYQHGFLAGIRPPSDLVSRIHDLSPGGEPPAVDTVVFAGTIPLIGGSFRDGRTWRGTLTLPDGRELNHEHDFVRTA